MCLCRSRFLFHSIPYAWSAFPALNASYSAPVYILTTNPSTHSFVLSHSFFFPLHESAKIVMMGLGRLVVTLKTKIKSLKVKKPYDKVEKSESMRVEIRSRKARKIIEETLKIADSPKSKTYTF
ncbi:hypothetical protein RIF29_14260 [Crotalaria pallida]|uniref:Uncharacterized protein n=1 Tax=Crotalaria pallida TaxID=3830 RepID=A0AAN9FF30_CROPI